MLAPHFQIVRCGESGLARFCAMIIPCLCQFVALPLTRETVGATAFAPMDTSVMGPV